jgi:hypothetical protein
MRRRHTASLGLVLQRILHGNLVLEVISGRAETTLRS